MENDAEINQRASLLPIWQVAERIGLSADDIEPYGRYMAKVRMEAVRRAARERRGRLIYTTAITATPAGEGKTTVAIGLTQALGRLGKRVAVCLREPSLGPTFGVKGGATGGGLSQVAPMVDINLHFTGDMHAVTSAHNLLAAAVDNHIHQGNALGLDPKRVSWRRVMDMNERQLRHVVVGLGGAGDGVVRETGFDITAASEVMAVLCLSRDLRDLKERLGRMVVGQTAGPSRSRRWVSAREIGVVGAMAVLLKDAIKPNLVQTLEGQPAFVHGGPFANIAHGNNSILATQTALGLADYVVTEGGFAADLGAEKFFDIVVPQTGLVPDVVVLVASIRALHHHGGASKGDLHTPNRDALQKGLSNLDRHIANIRKFGLPVVVAVNRFAADDPGEIRAVIEHCRSLGVRAEAADVVARGGEGGLELAGAVLETIEEERPDFRPIYRWEEPLAGKIERLATEIYGADGVDFTPEAAAALEDLSAHGFGGLPVCVAKTQFSITDDPSLRGAPTGWRLKVREIRPSLGAGFVIALTGEIMTMPGLPKEPAALRMDIDETGYVTGLS
ncbi:formate--tetrahydrofolate ligase [Carboxydochorda subterranea]|uniref:Formate--tetrahydrofolate ligase n=1 Tax=Carboxydichorda subterranea TaxID=3109565 RepID=A0ABZ1BW19_9FIRM|nr:formate--tetrahydrofolate ligase [Limnochorda sp. L945t]WRP16715.1 formate--tetrahydrofolate ligase [Limnochorda sp. L945t]